MRLMKRFGALALAVMLMVSLAACKTKAPTAAELMEGAKLDSGKYTDMTLKIDAAAETDGQSVTLTMTAGAELQGDVLHIYDAKLGIGMSGFAMEIAMEGWIDKGSNMTYVNMSALGQASGWTSSPMTESDGNMEAMTDLFSSLTGTDMETALRDHEKGEDYVVFWEFDGQELSDLLGDLAGDTGMTIDKMTVEAAFDETTHELKSVSAFGDADGTTMSVDVTFHTINGDDSLKVPDEVVSTAVPEDSGFDDIGYADDDGFFTGGDSDSDSWVSYNTPGVHDDGFGTDAIIDSIAQLINANDPSNQGIWVYHYSTTAELSYDTGVSGEWSGSLGITHVLNDATDTAQDLFDRQYSWLSDWYDDDAAMGSADGPSAVFIRDRSGYIEMDMAMYDGDMFYEVEVYAYSSTQEQALHYAQYMLAMAGLVE